MTSALPLKISKAPQFFCFVSCSYTELDLTSPNSRPNETVFQIIKFLQTISSPFKESLVISTFLPLLVYNFVGNLLLVLLCLFFHQTFDLIHVPHSFNFLYFHFLYFLLMSLLLAQSKDPRLLHYFLPKKWFLLLQQAFAYLLTIDTITVAYSKALLSLFHSCLLALH